MRRAFITITATTSRLDGTGNCEAILPPARRT
jgi:hypothetical protein